MESIWLHLDFMLALFILYHMFVWQQAVNAVKESKFYKELHVSQQSTKNSRVKSAESHRLNKTVESSAKSALLLSQSRTDCNFYPVNAEELCACQPAYEKHLKERCYTTLMRHTIHVVISSFIVLAGY